MGRQYRHYMRMRVESVIGTDASAGLYDAWDQENLLKGWNETNGKDKLSDFSEEYWHYDNITRQSEEEFADSYLEWEKGRDTIAARTKP